MLLHLLDEIIKATHKADKNVENVCTNFALGFFSFKKQEAEQQKKTYENKHSEIDHFEFVCRVPKIQNNSNIPQWKRFNSCPSKITMKM